MICLAFAVWRGQTAPPGWYRWESLALVSDIWIGAPEVRGQMLLRLFMSRPHRTCC